MKLNRRLSLTHLLGLSLLCPFLLQAENPHWIWHDNKGAAIKPDEVRYFRKTFNVAGKPGKAQLSVAADDEAIVYLNGKEVAKPKNYDKPSYEDVSSALKKGQNVLAIRAHNISGDQAGVVVMLEINPNKRQGDFVVTDGSWVSSAKEEPGWEKPAFNADNWTKAVSRGKLGDKPWGDVFKVPTATAAESLTTLPGFKVELLHSSEIGQGSWICMTVDQKGRLIISPQADSQPLLRITLSKSGHVSKIEPIPAPVHQAMGLLYAHDSLYVNGHGPSGTGLYRLIDKNHNDRFDTNEVHFLKKIEGEGEHGYHALVLGPDKMIYMMNGNHTKVPKGIAEDSPHKNYEEDFLLARQWDANGHAVGILAPGGYVVRTDPEGKKWDLMLAGFRNSYDFDFSPEGEMFTFDSDMEWDWGLPWYRPTRIIHCVTGGEYGWRSGSADWPEYYADSLPPVVNIGVGSPTGMKFGTKSNFPDKYRKALFALDWSYGRIFAVHLRPDGSSYGGDYEVFVKGKPLNVADIEFGQDGAMYFITGGRGTQSGLYRVSFLAKPSRRSPTFASPSDTPDAQARAVRRKLESYHGQHNLLALHDAWPYLGSADRFLRNAARIAIEWQDVSLWKNRALAETNTQAGLTALLALSRCGSKDTQRDLLMALKKFPLDSLSLTQKLEKLRIIELSFIRQGKPDADLAKLAIEKLDHLYPADQEFLNRELSQLLIYLEAPDAVTKTLALLDKAKTQEEQVHYIFYLRNLKTGWTLDQRKHYFDWFRFAQEATRGEVTYPQGSAYLVWTNQKKAAERHPADLLQWFREADRDYGDGASYPKYLVNIRKDAVAALTEEERVALSSWIEDYAGMAAFKMTKERKFVQDWQMSDLEPSLGQVAQGRNFEKAKAAFNDAQCLLCHRFGNEGGSVGPELTAASSKYSRRDILESILEPSKVISEQFQNTTIIKTDGDSETGRIVDETDDKIVVQPSPLVPDRVDIKKSEIAERRPAKVSPMPEGLLNPFTKEEILDLLAYIESSGKEKAPNFKAVEAAKH
jgi:putative heme-binding domain-containing protein